MATKLNFKSETDYIDDGSSETAKVELEFYSRTGDNLEWMIESFITFLRANEYSDEIIKQYFNWNGEIFKIGE
jgi:hypothetical protein